MAGRALAIPVPGPGRKSSYRPEYADQARKLCLLGATDKELADFFAVSETTIQNWKRAHPAFLASIAEGRVVADANVADSLYKRATGEYVQLEKLVKIKGEDGAEKYEAIRYKSYIPGDPNAAYRWLLNRRRQDWTDKTEHIVSGTIDHIVTKEQRDAAYAAAARADK